MRLTRCVASLELLSLWAPCPVCKGASSARFIGLREAGTRMKETDLTGEGASSPGMGQEGVGGPSQGLKSQAPAPLSRALSASPSLAVPTQHPEGCYDNHPYPV